MLECTVVHPALSPCALPSAILSLLAVYVAWTCVYVTVYGFAPLDQMEQSRLFIQQNAAQETQFLSQTTERIINSTYPVLQ